MFLIRKKSLEMLIKLYPEFSENLSIPNPRFRGIKYSDDEILKCLHYMIDAEYITAEKDFQKHFPAIEEIHITAKGIDWVENNLNISEQS